MKITKSRIRQLISESIINLLKEENESLKDDQIKWHFITAGEKATNPHRFIGITAEMLNDARNHPQKQSGYYEELAQKNNFKNYQILRTTVSNPEYALVELEGEKKSKKEDDILNGSSIEYVGSQIKKQGKKMKDFEYYTNSLGYVFAFPINSQDKRKENMRKIEYSEDQLAAVYDYTPF